MSPVTAQAADAFKQNNPAQYTAFVDALARKSAHTMTPKGSAMYNTLWGEYITDPEKFADADLSPLKGEVPDAVIQKLQKMQVTLPTSDAYRHAVSERWDGFVKKQLDPQHANVALSAEDYSQLFGAFIRKSEAFTKEHPGKYMDDETARKTINGLLVEGHDGSRGFFGGLNTVRQFQAKEGTFFQGDAPPVVPPDDAASITQYVRKTYNRAPTPEEIQRIYLAKHQ